AERTNWSPTASVLMKVRFLKRESDGLIRRLAIAAVGRQPRGDSFLLALTDALHDVDYDDSFLVHTLKIALRDQLRGRIGWPRLPGPEMNFLAGVALGIPEKNAAIGLLRDLRHLRGEPARKAEYLRHIARYGPED